MDAPEVRLTCPLCRTTLVAARSQFPEMAHSDVVAMNFLQKAMETHWARFCMGGLERPSLGAAPVPGKQPIVTFIRQSRESAPAVPERPQHD